jgi:hypothetical protein
MITLKNTGGQTMTWYALPKYSIDSTTALAHGTLAPQAQTTYNPPTTVNILFAFAGNKFAALCIAAQSSTVVFYQPSFGAWCLVS